MKWQLRSVLAKWLPTKTEIANQDIGASDESALIAAEESGSAIHTKALEMIGSLDPAQGKELASKVIGVYEENSIELMQALSDALNDGDEDRVRTTAHALKSSSANVGATRLTTMCRNIEKAAGEKQLNGLLEGFSAVEREHSQVLGELRKWSQG